MTDPVEMERKAQEVATSLAIPRPMRRGVVGERLMKCGKPDCACHRDPAARHGPYYSLTRGVGGTTRSKYLTAEQAAAAKRQITAGQEFRAQVDAFWEVCEQWADAELEQAQVASTEEATKKKASKRPSTLKSSARSKR